MKHSIKTKPCPECGLVATLYVELPALIEYEGGAHVQVAFPEMSADDRERLITGLCPKCFPPPEDTDG